jgi:hypothetical protein
MAQRAVARQLAKEFLERGKCARTIRSAASSSLVCFLGNRTDETTEKEPT